MSKIKSLCGKCSNNCKEGFTIFTSEEEAKKIVSKHPFFKIVGKGADIVGKSKRNYHIFKCEKLMENNECDNHPADAPVWCKIKA